MREATDAVLFRASCFRRTKTTGNGLCCETIEHCSNGLFRYETVTMGCDEPLGPRGEVEGAKRPMELLNKSHFTRHQWREVLRPLHPQHSFQWHTGVSNLVKRIRDSALIGWEPICVNRLLCQLVQAVDRHMVPWGIYHSRVHSMLAVGRLLALRMYSGVASLPFCVQLL